MQSLRRFFNTNVARGVRNRFAARPVSVLSAKPLAPRLPEVHNKCARTFALDAHALPKEGTAEFNPEWKADGNEGGVDTNKLPWVPLPHLPGCSFKPLRASPETGAFTVIIKVPKGTDLPKAVHLGAADTFILSGKVSYKSGPFKGTMGQGMWAYNPANSVVEGAVIEEDTEYLATFYGPVAYLNPAGGVQSMFTGEDVKELGRQAGINLLPNTLAEALHTPKKEPYSGPTEELQMSKDGSMAALNRRAGEIAIATELTNPHFVDTNALPWIVNPDSPDIGLKIMRVSTETGFVSMIVRQNGQAPPHYHLGAADFFITNGRLGYRAGPKDGYGPGTYMFEPAGARHEATQRTTDEDLIYTANVYGPIQFDSGIGTPVLMVMSWMQYLEAAKAFNSPLLQSTFPHDDNTMLASSMFPRA